MKLSELLKNSLYTDRELSKMSGVSHMQIWRLKQERYDPKLSTVRKLLKALNKKMSDLDN